MCQRAAIYAGNSWISSLAERYQFHNLETARKILCKLPIEFTMVHDDDKVDYIDIIKGKGLPEGCSINLSEEIHDDGVRMMVIVFFEGGSETFCL